MPTVRFEPNGQTITIDNETTLREAAHLAQAPLGDKCGGMGACCGCVVTVVNGAENITPKTTIETAVFYLAENDRLSCQCKITGDVILQSGNANVI